MNDRGKIIASMKFVAPVLILAILVSYFGYLSLFLQNYPRGFDDVMAINQFLNQYQISTTLSEKLELAFTPYREHVLLTCKLSTLLYWKVVGNFNFAVYAFIGNFCFVGIAALLTKKCWRSGDGKLIYFIPVFLLLFHAQFMETSLWAMAVWSNGWVVFWALLSLYCLDKSMQNVERNNSIYFVSATGFSYKTICWVIN